MFAFPEPARLALHHASFNSEPVAAVRLVIIEDFRFMAQMLHLLCVERWGLEVPAVTHGGEEGLQAVGESKPDLVLLDIGLPDVDGLTLLPRLRQASPASKIIIFSALYNDCTVGRMLQAGWDGAIDKVADGMEFIREAIQTVRRGHRYTSPAVYRLFARYRESHNPFHHALSEREKEILACIAHALGDDEIAERTGITAATAKAHRKRLFNKLGQPNTPKLMHYAIRHGYGSLPLPAGNIPNHTGGR